MTKESQFIIATSLTDMGVQLNELFAQGYAIAAGWPIQLGWHYEVQLEKEVVRNTLKKAKE